MNQTWQAGTCSWRKPVLAGACDWQKPVADRSLWLTGACG